MLYLPKASHTFPCLSTMNISLENGRDIKLLFNKGVHKLKFSKIEKKVWSIMFFFFSKIILKYLLPLTISCLIAATDCTQLSVTDFAGLCQETKCSNSLCVLEMKIWVTLKPWQFVAIQLNHRRQRQI